MKTEGLNKVSLFFLGLVAAGGLYFLYAPSDNNKSKSCEMTRRTAYTICTDVCQGNNKVVMQALQEKFQVFSDNGTYEALLEGIDGACEADCARDIKP